MTNATMSFGTLRMGIEAVISIIGTMVCAVWIGLRIDQLSTNEWLILALLFSYQIGNDLRLFLLLRRFKRMGIA